MVALVGADSIQNVAHTLPSLVMATIFSRLSFASPLAIASGEAKESLEKMVAITNEGSV